MAGRSGAGDGILAGAVARADVRRLQGSWGLGFALSGLAYGFLYGPLEAWHKGYGWRGMLILGVLPALACVWIRMYVKEPEVWAENKKIQNATQKQVTLPLFAIFKRKYLYNTLTGVVWMAANFCTYYAVWAMLGTYLTKELGWTPAQVAVPVFWGNILTFMACSFWGAVSERVGRRWALMIPTFIALFLIPLYITQIDPALFLGFFLLFICFFSGKDALNPGWLSERFPTEVRATAAGFIYHQGAVWGAAVAPILTYFAVNQGMGFAKPMMYGSIGSLVVYIIAVYLGPETKGMIMTADLEVVMAEPTRLQPDPNFGIRPDRHRDIRGVIETVANKPGLSPERRRSGEVGCRLHDHGVQSARPGRGDDVRSLRRVRQHAARWRA